MPDAPAAFKTPWVPFVPLMGIITCLFMMVFLPFDTWIRLLVWMLIGLHIYMSYGIKKSKLGEQSFFRRGKNTAAITGICLSIMLLIVAVLHQNEQGFDADLSLMIVSLITGILYAGYFSYQLYRKK